MLVFHTQVGCLQHQALAARTSRWQGTFAFTYVVLVALFVALALQLWIRISVTHEGYSLEEARVVAIRNDARLRQLKAEYAQQTNPQALSERAKTELSMERLAPENIRRIALSQ